MRLLTWLWRALITVGLVCVGWTTVAWLQTRHFQAEQSRLLQRAATNRAPVDATVVGTGGSTGLSAAIGRLEIPRLGISVVVTPGDDEATLRRAVGYLTDTALPWDGGNTALAGHRDTFFKPLERVQQGDDIYLETPRGSFHYRVRRSVVVEPEDVWVLDPSPTPVLTLITCYPFRYLGAAPHRFIVQADRV